MLEPLVTALSKVCVQDRMDAYKQFHSVIIYYTYGALRTFNAESLWFKYGFVAVMFKVIHYVDTITVQCTLRHFLRHEL